MLTRVFRSTVLVGALLAIIGYSGARVRVVDIDGEPVPDAALHIVYLSFGGPVEYANDNGVVRYSSWYFFEVAHVTVDSPTQGSADFPYPPPAEVLLDGSRVDEPIPLPLPVW